MRYRVIWTNRAVEVTRVAFFLAWEAGGDHAALDRAVTELNAQLSDDPIALGESRNGNERIAFAGPVSILFEPFPPSAVVLVYRANLRR